MSSRALSQVTHETVTHDAKGGSLSVWWDPGRTALVSKPTAYPGVTTTHLGCKGEGEGETGREENGSGSMAMGMGTVVIQAMREK